MATVKGYAAHESQTLENVINARANATKTGIDPESLTEENIARYQQMQGEIGSAIGRLLVSVEQYPELKADKNFLDLQAQLEGTENRITVERQKFNEAVKRYNTKIRMFPNNLIANIFGFEKRGYFSSDEGAENAPVVNFE